MYHLWLLLKSLHGSPFALSLQGPLHEIPRKAVDIFPKFNGEGNDLSIEHIIKCESIICLLNIVYEDIVCRLFPLTFEAKVFNHLYYEMRTRHSSHFSQS